MSAAPAPVPDPRFCLPELVRTLRPHQWLKNAFLFAPLVFARHLFALDDVLRVAAAFGLFSLVAGSVYIVNDVLDLEVDRAHPVKRRRPLAAGRLGVRDALVAMGVLLAVALLGMAALSIPAAAWSAAYFLLNVAYSRVLKHVPFVDVATIAAGFLIRVLVGGLVIAVPITAWLLACTFLLAVFLGLGKRRHELVLLLGTGEAKRPVLERYRLRHLDGALAVSGLVTAASYLAYTLDPVTVAKFGTTRLVWTTPFIVLGLLRFGQLMLRADNPRSPTDSMLHDLPFGANLLAWGAAVVFILYIGARDVTPSAPSTPSATRPSGRGRPSALPLVDGRGTGRGSADGLPSAAINPGPDMIVLRVRSVPFGAEVRLDGKVLGVTPLEVRVPAGEAQRHLSLHLAGYEVREMDLALTRDVGMGLMLKKIERGVAPGSAGAPAGKEPQ